MVFDGVAACVILSEAKDLLFVNRRCPGRRFFVRRGGLRMTVRGERTEYEPAYEYTTELLDRGT